MYDGDTHDCLVMGYGQSSQSVDIGSHHNCIPDEHYVPTLLAVWALKSVLIAFAMSLPCFSVVSPSSTSYFFVDSLSLTLSLVTVAGIVAVILLLESNGQISLNYPVSHLRNKNEEFLC